jgi:hypothetical protein
VQRRDRPGAELDRLRSCGQQHPDGFTFAAPSRLAHPNAGERLACCTHRVDVVVLDASPPHRTLRTLNFHDPFASRQQHSGQAGAEGASALNGPQRRAVPSSERDELSIPLRIRRHRQMFQDSARRSHRRGGVRVLVRVDTDDGVEMFCQHGHRSLTRE